MKYQLKVFVKSATANGSVEQQEIAARDVVRKNIKVMKPKILKKTKKLLTTKVTVKRRISKRRTDDERRI